MKKGKQTFIACSLIISLLFLIHFTYVSLKSHPKNFIYNKTQHTILDTYHIDHKADSVFKFLAQQQSTHKKDTRDVEMAKVLDDPLLNGAIVGLSLRDAKTGELLYEHFGDTHLRPASNMKLLTATAAFDVLGPDYEFTTEILTDGDLENGHLRGNLYIKGQGDPTLLKEDLDQFATDLKEKGMTKLTGDLIADDTWYDDVRYSQDLNWTDESFYTGAQISALTISPNDDYHTGTVIVRVYPNDNVGDKPKVVTEPETNYLNITNNAQTGKEGSENSLSVEREHGTNELIIEGFIPQGSITKLSRAVWEPSYYVLNVLKTSLTEQGIHISKDSHMRMQKTPRDSDLLLTKKSIPLKDIIIPFMKLSNNGIGEMLIKEMGRVINDVGSWDEGLHVMEESLEKRGMDTSSILLRDGSGMSHKNLVSPNAITDLLFHVQAEPWFSLFENAQPIGGESNPMVGGTLSNRMLNEPLKGNVKAKTGALNGVSTLSGYLDTPSGEKRIFSIMINNYVDSSMSEIEDRVVELFLD